MSRTNLHQGYNTLLAAKAFAVLDENTKGATNADGLKTFEEEIAELNGEPLFYEEEFSSRATKKQRRVVEDDIKDTNTVRKNRSNLDE